MLVETVRCHISMTQWWRGNRKCGRENIHQKSFISSLSNFLHSPVTLSLLDPNILLSTLFSIALSLRELAHKQWNLLITI